MENFSYLSMIFDILIRLKAMDNNAQADVNIRNAIGLVLGGSRLCVKIYIIFAITPPIRLNAARIPSIH
jgi:hypothetical protein